MSTHVPVVIAGAGISGLVCGYALRKAGVGVLVVEGAARPGGLIRSERRDGYLLEMGPQSFSGTAQIRTLCRELGIEQELVEAPARAPRFLLLDGQLRAVPLSPPAFFASSLFSAKTKWALVRDVFAHHPPPEPDESMADFTRRKFSEELLDKLVGPFVSGIYAGDPEKLSLRAAFPQVHEAEKAAGSIIRGMLRAVKAKRKAAAANGAAPQKRERPTLQTFREGNETLVQALAANLGAALRTGTSVKEIRRRDEGATGAGRYVVALERDGQREEITAEHVVLATPTDVTGRLLSGLSKEVATALAPVEHAPVAVVSLGYAQAAVGRELNGFGFLIPRSAKVRTLGTVWNSSLFAGRAPSGHVLLTSFAGGASDAAATTLGEVGLRELVHAELAPILKIASAPAFASVTVYPRALPQYNLGHAARLASVQAALVELPGVFLAGNYLRGPAIGACVEQALGVAEEIGGQIGRTATATRN